MSYLRVGNGIVPHCKGQKSARLPCQHSITAYTENSSEKRARLSVPGGSPEPSLPSYGLFGGSSLLVLMQGRLCAWLEGACLLAGMLATLP